MERPAALPLPARAAAGFIKRSNVPSRLACIEVRSHGADDAVWLAQTTARVMVGALSDVHLRRVLATSTILDIIPRDRKLTEIAGLTWLGGRKTHDGRSWEDVRGVYAHRRNGARHVAVGAEALDGVGTGYLPLFVLVHEMAHALYWTALDDTQRAAVEARYATLKASGTFVDAYAASNVAEYFAQSVSAYFGVPVQRSNAAPFRPEWLRQNDPVMFGVLADTFTHWPVGEFDQPSWWVSRLLEMSGRHAVATPRGRRGGQVWPELGCLTSGSH